MSLTLTEALTRRPEGARPRLVPYLLVDHERVPGFQALARGARLAGADALELGFPFTDPIADGPVLQAASDRALVHKTRWSDLLIALRAASRELPCAVMTYANPVFHQGLETATQALRHAGASGLIVPDLSWEDSRPWRAACRRAGLALVQMAAPGTSPGRVKVLVNGSMGFLYLVSRYGTTGGTGFSATPQIVEIVSRAHEVRPELPVLVGFGIRSPSDARRVLATGADGVVVGSALEEAVGSRATEARVTRFLRPLAGALGRAGG